MWLKSLLLLVASFTLACSGSDTGVKKEPVPGQNIADACVSMLTQTGCPEDIITCIDVKVTMKKATPLSAEVAELEAEMHTRSIEPGNTMGKCSCITGTVRLLCGVSQAGAFTQVIEANSRVKECECNLQTYNGTHKGPEA